VTDRFELIEGRTPQTYFGLLGAPEPPSVRRFSDEALQAQVDRVLASLPADKRAVEVEVGGEKRGDETVVAGIVAVRLSAGWSLRGQVNWEPGVWGGRVAARWVGK